MKFASIITDFDVPKWSIETKASSWNPKILLFVTDNFLKCSYSLDLDVFDFNLKVISDAQTIDVGTLKEIPDILPFKFFTHLTTALIAVVFFWY